MEKRKRVDLRVRLENPSEAEALNKIQNYDREKYNSMSDYILHAVLAYAEPIYSLKGKGKRTGKKPE